MARPIWDGTISFGLVTVPVALYGATEEHNVHFNQLERDTSDRIRYKRVNERTGKEVAYSDIVKGYEVAKGEYVIVEPDELAEIAPGRSRSIEIEAFVELNEIDPIYFQKAYWLAPTDEGYAHAYHLLLRAMAETNRVGIALFVMRGKQYLTAVRAGDGVLTLETMYFADEVRDPAKTIPALPKPDNQRPNELSMAVELIKSMTGPWNPQDYRDTYEEKVRELIEAKREGRTAVPAADAEEPTKVIDLTEALRRSVRRSGGGKAGSSAAGSGSSGSSDEGEPSAERSRTTQSGGGRSAQSGQDDTADMSKTDLLKLARDLDVKGRSAMSRDELAEAVRAARRSSGRKKVS